MAAGGRRGADGAGHRQRRGFFAEEFARLGFAVTGVDPSDVSVQTARDHARAGGLDIDYRTCVGERLPVRDATFDVAYCSDVLEHRTDVDAVLAETSRVLRPGGVYLFDTPNRTLASELATAMPQRWRLTRVVDFTAHDRTMFLRPAELAGWMRMQGMAVQETVGLVPRPATFALKPKTDHHAPMAAPPDCETTVSAW